MTVIHLTVIIQFDHVETPLKRKEKGKTKKSQYRYLECEHNDRIRKAFNFEKGVVKEADEHLWTV